MILNLLASSAAVSLVAYVYSQILTEAGMILNPWLLFLDKHFGYGSMKAGSEQPRAFWLFKMLVGCFRCVAGQFALWYYLMRNFEAYDLFDHIFYICFAIFLSQLIHKVYTYART